MSNSTKAESLVEGETFIGDDLITEGLKVLAEKCEKSMADLSSNRGKFNIGKAAELIFNLCQKFELPVEVKYAAIELFDQFMTIHITELQEIVRASSSAEKQLDWSSVEARIKDQVVLRAMTCVQISSKLVSHYKAVHPSKVKRYLSACNLHYSMSSVNKSEMRVLTTVNYQLPLTTPIVHIEMLLEVFKRNCDGVNVDLILKAAINILDVSYISRTRLKDLLRYASTDDGEETLKRRCVSNHFLLAACVIVAASYVIDSSTNDTVIEQIALITCLDESDIIIYSTILVKLALHLE
uniref:Cyclin N-terminal domain-containing protein n=2 Tax=Clytia hemisphaerica TaxID=252671 RepID=A0A7M5X6A1_9CNID